MSPLLAILTILGAAAAAALMFGLVHCSAGGPLMGLGPWDADDAGRRGRFAVLLAFVIQAAFQTYNGARTGAGSEA